MVVVVAGVPAVHPAEEAVVPRRPHRGRLVSVPGEEQPGMRKMTVTSRLS